MKEWKHISLDQRKVIASGIVHNYKLKDIAEALGLDPTSISKEVKRNRDAITVGAKQSSCKRIVRWPYVCTGCNKRYGQCPLTKYKYDPRTAQRKATINLVQSRRGIDTDAEEFKQLDQLIKEGIDNNQSIYQIKIKHSDKIKPSLTTLYRYINNGYLTTKRMDLPYAVTYKKRKHNKKYDYSNNNIDRSNHTYLDYLVFIHQFPGVYVWQLDFLGSIKTDNKNILSFHLPNLQFIILKLIQTPDAAKVVQFFDKIEEQIGIDAFKALIPVILTDRDPRFADITGICFSKVTGEERCKLFFCDPYVSNQKPHVENMNKQLRLFFPKGTSIDKYQQDDIEKTNLALLNRPLRSLDGNTPKDAFIKVFDADLFHQLFL